MTNNKIIRHDWGYELNIAKKSDYSGKILVFERANSCTKLLLHKQKDKTWFVNAGSFKVMYIDYSNGSVKEVELKEGQTFNVLPMVPNKLTALQDNSSVTEMSNSGDDADIYYLT